MVSTAVAHSENVCIMFVLITLITCAGVLLAGRSGTDDSVADATGDFHEISLHVLPGRRSRKNLRNSRRVSFVVLLCTLVTLRHGPSLL